MFVYFVRYVVFSGLENPGTLVSQTELCWTPGESFLKPKFGTSRKTRDEWDPYLWADEDIFHCCHPFAPSIQTIHYDSRATLSPSYTNNFFQPKPQPSVSTS